MMTFRSIEEKLLYYTLLLTWVWYFLGAMYVVPPVVGWGLAGVWFARVIRGDQTRPLPTLVMVWMASMLVMEGALIVGHLNWNLGIPLLIKSSVGWIKGWALFAVFTLIGGCMRVRAEVMAKASALLAFQTLCLIPIFIAAPYMGIPGTLYSSPLMALGGPGPEYFEVQIYGSGFDGGTRWRFFAPWAPAAAVAFGILAPIILRYRSVVLSLLGSLTVVLVVTMSKSRLGLISIPCSLLFTAAISRAVVPRVLFTLAALAVMCGLLGDPLTSFLNNQRESLAQMRADSSYVRDILGRIAIYRWQTEAPFFGHGVVETGPPIVESMPIGSHHSWYGLLFVKGAVGFIALLVPLLFSFAVISVRAQKSRNARTALAVLIFFAFSTMTENVEMLAYLTWPGFVMLGIAAGERRFHPFRFPLGMPGQDTIAAARTPAAPPQ
jgi:hypothetical protein